MPVYVRRVGWLGVRFGQTIGTVGRRKERKKEEEEAECEGHSIPSWISFAFMAAQKKDPHRYITEQHTVVL